MAELEKMAILELLAEMDQRVTQDERAHKVIAAELEGLEEMDIVDEMAVEEGRETVAPTENGDWLVVWV